MSRGRQIVSGELHYPRIPPEYWSARLRMARAMGLNAISTYVFWNCHEPSPGVFDFADGYDVAQFVRLAQEHGLGVILRPGPYVCAEWDLGGLPAWLLAGDRVALRTTDPRYLEPVRRWMCRLGEELAPLQRTRGGPIFAVQLENEYGAFGSDDAYLRALRQILREAGFEAPLFTIDQPRDLRAGSLPDVPAAVTFAPGDPDASFAALRALRPDAPLLCGEYWAGWFDHWGEPHADLDAERQAADLEWMLAAGASVNVYMLHGGTNFGFFNGANAFEPHPYQPTTSSYDYQAAIDEAGRPTQKYYAFREIITRITGAVPPEVPQVPPIADAGTFELFESVPLAQTLPAPELCAGVANMEHFGQAFGYILYRTGIDAYGPRVLHIEQLKDYAVVCLDGVPCGTLDRRLGESELTIECTGHATLDILVENGGRINYGPQLPFERKGAAGVSLDGLPLGNWRIYPLPFERLPERGYAKGCAASPAFYRGYFELERPGDVFLDVSDLRKGVLWVNGRNAGRFWEIGPQRSLYVPGPWLRSGRNVVAALELFGRTAPPRLRGTGR